MQDSILGWLELSAFCQYIMLYFLNQGAAKHIKIHEDTNGGIYTVGVTMKQVHSAKEVSCKSLSVSPPPPRKYRKFCCFVYFQGGVHCLGHLLRDESKWNSAHAESTPGVNCAKFPLDSDFSTATERHKK